MAVWKEHCHPQKLLPTSTFPIPLCITYMAECALPYSQTWCHLEGALLSTSYGTYMKPFGRRSLVAAASPVVIISSLSTFNST